MEGNLLNSIPCVHFNCPVAEFGVDYTYEETCT